MAIIKIVLSIAFIYALLITILYSQQRDLMYHPYTFTTYDDLGDLPQNIEIYTVDGVEWPVIRAAKQSNKAVVYFHGNAGAAIHRVEKMQAWVDAGYHVVLAEYPGFGSNINQEISEDALYQAARVAVGQTIKTFPNAEIYLYGESLGSGIAVQMATEYDVAGLIIEAGFSSMVDVAKSRYWFAPVNLLLQDRYESVKKMPNVIAPYVHIHGREDKTVPFWAGQKLFDAHKGQKHMIAIEAAGHNNIFDYINMPLVIEQFE